MDATNRFIAFLIPRGGGGGGRGEGRQKYVWVEVCFSAKTNYLKQIYKCDQVSIYIYNNWGAAFSPRKVLKRVRG